MAVTNGYCTEAELRAHLGDSGSKLVSDLLDRAINSASRAIDRYCGRRFWKDASVTTRLYRPDDECVLYVDDIATSTGLVLKTDDDLDGSYETTWTTADYQLEPLNSDSFGAPFSWYRIVAVDTKTFPVCSLRASVQLTAQFGWSAVPDEVTEACLLKASSLFRRKDAPFGIAGVSDFGPVRISRTDPDVMSLLAPYRLPVVG